MLGIPRPDFPSPPPPPPPSVSDEVPEDDPVQTPRRPRAHVRYDSMLEAPGAIIRRRRLFVVGGVLVALSAGWLIYRFLNG